MEGLRQVNLGSLRLDAKSPEPHLRKGAFLKFWTSPIPGILVKKMETTIGVLPHTPRMGEDGFFRGHEGELGLRKACCCGSASR